MFCIQPQKERRRVNAAVVAAEGNLAGRGHLAGTNSCTILPGCSRALRQCGYLDARERLQRANRKIGMNGRIDSAVMILSRPNSVANHGTPPSVNAVSPLCEISEGEIDHRAAQQRREPIRCWRKSSPIVAACGQLDLPLT